MPTINCKIKVKDTKGNETTRCEITAQADADVATIKIIGEISWWKNSSEEFIAQMEAIKAAGIKTLNCYINSPGGSVWDANEIYNQLKAFDGKRTLEIGAICASAATIVAMAFEKEDTEGASNMAYMLHNPRGSVFDAEVKDLEATIQLLKNTKDTILKQYQKRTGQTKTWISNKMDATWWMTPEIAKQYGFIGKIKEEDDSLPEDTGDVFNRYQFENVPSVLNKAINHEEEEEEEESEPVIKPEKLKPNFMKDFLKLLLATMTGLTDFIKADASDADVVAGLNRAFAAKESKIIELTNDAKTKGDRITALENDLKAQNILSIKSSLDAAETAKKITPAQRAEFEKQADKIGLEGINAILATLTPRASVKDQIVKDGKTSKKEGGAEEDDDDEAPKAKNLKEMTMHRIAKMNASGK